MLDGAIDCFGMFDAAWVINLARRPERLRKFFDRFGPEWPDMLPPYVRVEAIDGSRVAIPGYFTEQPGAWGCLRTHLRLYEDSMSRGDKKGILIMEDDAVPCEGFKEKAAAFLAKIPLDWDMIYLGGLHRTPDGFAPIEHIPGVWLGRAITTTYAYAVSARFLPTLYRTLMETAPNHIDQMLARAMSANFWRVYCPPPTDWLVGMDEGPSDICDRVYQGQHWWKFDPNAREPASIVLHQTLARQTVRSGQVRDEALDANEATPQLASNIGGWFSPACGKSYRARVKNAILNAEIEQRQPRMAEVGCWKGRSLSFLADFIKSGDIHATAIDTWKGNSEEDDPTHGRDVYEQFRGNMADLDMLDVLSVMRMPSIAAARQFEDKSLDLVMIDADHEKGHVAADIEAWWPKIIQGGVLMGHDYSRACGCPGVVEAVNEFSHRNGLIVVADADMWIIDKPLPARVTMGQEAAAPC